MKAIQISRFGEPDVLELVDVATPVPRPGEVLVRNQASGVNFFEVLMRADRYAVTPQLPLIPGVEIAGVVEALGEGVRSPGVGARVAVPLFAFGRGAGGYAEFTAVDAASAVPLPAELSFDDATALMVQGLTALHLVRRRPPRGKTILVTAAAGGVGTLVVQLAAKAGARVITAASSAAKLELARSLGAHSGVDYSQPGWQAQVLAATGGQGVDIVYDLVGGPLTKSCLGALAPGGDLVFGALGRFELVRTELDAMLEKNQSVTGFALLPLLTPAATKADLHDLFLRAARGELQVIRGGRYALHDAAAAHRAHEDRTATGKIVLHPSIQ
jgi:NADPH:quinone reductase